MNEINQLKKLMEAVVYNEAQFDDEPFIQAHNLPGDKIIDNYRNGSISYEEAEVQLIQFYDLPGDLEMAMGELNAAYGDSDEIEWDEESGGGIVRETVTGAKGKIITSLTNMSPKYDFFVNEYNGISVYNKYGDDLLGAWDDFDSMLETGLGDR